MFKKNVRIKKYVVLMGLRKIQLRNIQFQSKLKGKKLQLKQLKKPGMDVHQCYRLFLTQEIEKAALAHIGGSCYNHLNTTAQPFASPLIRKMLLYFHLQLGYCCVH